MGLLDNLLFGQNADFGGQQGGLLDFLRSSQMQNSQYQPSAGFLESQPPTTFADRFGAAPGMPAAFAPSGRSFDTAQFDPSTYAPNQAQPIAVGNYQMPRVGSADQFTSPPSAMAAIPQNAQPTQGQMPASTDISAQSRQPQQEQPLPPAFGGGSVLGRLGNPDGLIARLTGNDSRSVSQQNLRAQYDSLRQALIGNGETPQSAASKAMVAVMNPEAAKTIIPELFTNKEKYGVISEDPFAGKRYGFINERDQTVNGKPLSAQGAGSSTPLVDLENAKAAGVSGNALYEYLPKQIAPMVKAMIEGRQPLPSGAAMRNPATLALIDAAHSIDPTFDATSWKGRQAGVVDYASGKSSEMVRSANQTLHHVNSLLDSMDALKNGSIPLWNRVGNATAEATGSGAQGAFRTNAHAVAEELSKVFKGSNLSDAEIHAWEQNLHENMSPEQQRTQIAKLKELLGGSLHALEEKRLAAIGPMAAEKAGPIIKEDAQRVMKRIDDWVKGAKGTASATPADPLGIR